MGGRRILVYLFVTNYCERGERVKNVYSEKTRP
jgi:hypothetical protein